LDGGLESPPLGFGIYRMKSKTQVGQAFSLRRASARLLGTRRISPALCPSTQVLRGESREIREDFEEAG